MAIDLKAKPKDRHQVTKKSDINKSAVAVLEKWQKYALNWTLTPFTNVMLWDHTVTLQRGLCKSFNPIANQGGKKPHNNQFEVIWRNTIKVPPLFLHSIWTHVSDEVKYPGLKYAWSTNLALKKAQLCKCSPWVYCMISRKPLADTKKMRDETAAREHGKPERSISA